MSNGNLLGILLLKVSTQDCRTTKGREENRLETADHSFLGHNQNTPIQLKPATCIGAQRPADVTFFFFFGSHC